MGEAVRVAEPVVVIVGLCVREAVMEELGVTAGEVVWVIVGLPVALGVPVGLRVSACDCVVDALGEAACDPDWVVDGVCEGGASEVVKVALGVEACEPDCVSEAVDVDEAVRMVDGVTLGDGAWLPLLL